MMKKYYVNWSVEGILSNWGKVFGRCWGVHGKHTRSTAADHQPALLPDYKVTWLWGGGGGGHGKHTRSTAADQPALLPNNMVLGGGVWGGVRGGFGAQLLQTSLLVFRNTK